MGGGGGGGVGGVGGVGVGAVAEPRCISAVRPVQRLVAGANRGYGHMHHVLLDCSRFAHRRAVLSGRQLLPVLFRMPSQAYLSYLSLHLGPLVELKAFGHTSLMSNGPSLNAGKQSLDPWPVRMDVVSYIIDCFAGANKNPSHL